MSIFDDDIFKEDIYDYVRPLIDIDINFGDLLLYDQNNQSFYIKSSKYKYISESISIGVILSEYKTDSYYVLLKNFLTNEPEKVPYSYFKKEKYIPAYLKELYYRYVSKYIRSSDIDISSFEFIIPDIQLLDILDKNQDTIMQSLNCIQSAEKTNTFFNRIYTSGLFSIYKQQFYQWLPNKNDKRVINNFIAGNTYEFLPVFKYIKG